MVEGTTFSLPASVKFPVVITGILEAADAPVDKHTPLLRYKYWDLVEEAIDVQDEIEGSIEDDEPMPAPSSRRQSVAQGRRRSSVVASTSGGELPTRKVRHEFFSTFEAPVQGQIDRWLVSAGDEIVGTHQPIVQIVEPCTHSVQYGGLCAICGASLDEEEDYTEFKNQNRAPIAMSHDTSGLTVSYNEAERIEKSTSERLLSERKLILVVDLDQTVIHAAVDPTIGEWMRDEANPNHEAVKDVRTFSLDEVVGSRRRNGAPDRNMPATALCWYYVKLRPGLTRFLEAMAEIYEMHIYTMATKSYAKAIAKIIDPEAKYFGDRILSRDDSGSLLQKSLERLFPVSTSMVAIIDDRGDVWKWSKNLIKVVPFNFFVGIGDINSSFLPQRTGEMIESSMKKKEERASDDSPKVSEPTSEPEKGAEDEAKEESMEESNEESNEESKEEPKGQQTQSTVDQLVALGGGEDNAELLKVQASERSASLEQQQLERPLAKLQHEIEEHRRHSKDKSPEDKGGNATTKETSSETKPAPSDHLLNDEDNELVNLEHALKLVYKKFYKDYDAGVKPPPELTKIIPHVKEQVFDGCVFVLSEIVPLGKNFDNADIVQWVRSFGAVVVGGLIDSVTHVVATSGGTKEVRMAASDPRIKIVYVDWVYACIAAWKRLPEDEYIIEVKDPLPRGVKKLKLADVEQASGQQEEVVERFRQSLTDGDIDWDEADKELAEFMGSDEEEEDGDGDGDDDDDDEDEDEDEDENDMNGNKNGEDDGETRNGSSLKRARDESEEDEPTKQLRVDDDAGDESDSYDDDLFAKELEDDLL